MTLRNFLDVVLLGTYIEVFFPPKDSKDYNVQFSGVMERCPENLMDMEVALVFANGELDDECLYIEVR